VYRGDVDLSAHEKFNEWYYERENGEETDKGVSKKVKPN
jgi:hypothetical protein